MKSSLNIIVFGATGVGKSSMINLIAGREVATTSPDLQGGTMSFKPYKFDVSEQTYCFWDTVGLEEPEMGVNGYLAAIESAVDLINHIYNQGGVDLLLLCLRGNRITATEQSNYRLFYEVLCQSQVPIAIVVTHLEREPRMDDWWDRNQDSLCKYGFKFVGHACITGLPRHRKREESKENMTRLLRGYNGDHKFSMLPEGWFVKFLRAIGLTTSLKKDWKRKDIVKYLTRQCRLDTMVAERVADQLMECNE